MDSTFICKDRAHFSRTVRTRLKHLLKQVEHRNPTSVTQPPSLPLCPPCPASLPPSSPSSISAPCAPACPPWPVRDRPSHPVSVAFALPCSPLGASGRHPRRSTATSGQRSEPPG